MSDELDSQALLEEARQGNWRPVDALVAGEIFPVERAAPLL
jgi:hypothetical protein